MSSRRTLRSTSKHLSKKRTVLQSTETNTLTETSNIYLKCNGITDLKVIEKHDLIPHKNLIKLIKNSDVIDYNDYSRNIFFKHVGNFTFDESIQPKRLEKNRPKRKTIRKIDFLQSREFNNNKFKKEGQDWLYLICINNKIVKIGGTHAGLKNRIHGYLAGHIGQRDPHKYNNDTNAKVYATIKFYLELGCDVSIYAYEITEEFIKKYISIFGQIYPIAEQVYHVYEGIFFADFFRLYGKYPILGKYADTKYKNFKGLTDNNIAYIKKNYTHLLSPTRNITKTPNLGKRFSNKRNKIRSIKPPVFNMN